MEGPETDYSRWMSGYGALGLAEGITLKRGNWKTDAKKRTAMVEATRCFRPEPTWGVWIDGDEVLMNGEYLEDWCQHWTWADEVDLRNDPEAQPRMGWPIDIMELDGSLGTARGKVVRVDLIDSYSVSSSVFVNALGMIHGEGNYPKKFSEWMDPRFPYIMGEEDRMFMLPPFPTTPFLVHRSHLRHPDRRGVRMHEQESEKLAEWKRELGVSEQPGFTQRPD